MGSPGSFVQRTPVRSALATALFVLSSISLLFGRLDFQLEQTRLDIRRPAAIQRGPPSPERLRRMLLGFDSLAADVAWISTLIYFGNVEARGLKPDRLTEYAHTIQQIDPRFRPIYTWYDGLYVGSNRPLDHREIEKVNEFLRSGMEYFPTDWKLPYTAGLNYIGGNDDESLELRLDEVNAAIDLLTRASKLEGAPDRLPLTIMWLYDRRHQLRRKLETGETSDDSDRHLSKQQLEFLSEVYFLVKSEDVRHSLSSVLRAHPSGKRALAERRRLFQHHFRDQWRRRFAYLPAGLWNAVVETSNDYSNDG